MAPVQPESVVSMRVKAGARLSSPPAQATQIDRQRLAADAARAIRQRLHAELVWIGEVKTPLFTALDGRDGDEGFGPPPVVVLASQTQHDYAQPVLPTCLLQIAWETANLNAELEMDLRNPRRTLVAMPAPMPSGSCLVLVAVVRDAKALPGLTRDLKTYAVNLARWLDLASSQEPVTICASGE